MKKVIIAGILTTVFTLSFTGCGSDNSRNAGSAPAEQSAAVSSSEKASPDSPAVSKDEIQYKDIAWAVEQGQYNGSEFCLFSYTNNSPFIITDMEMRFEQKKDTTDEQRAQLFGELKETWDMDDKDIAKMYLAGYTKKIADPGETISDKPMYLNSFFGATDYDMFSIMEPKSITVSFIGSDGRIHSGEIDCQSEKYRDTGKTIVADQWSDSSLAQLLPKPDSTVITVSFDRDDVYWAYAYGMTSIDYENYIENCQSLGFTNDVSSFDFTETSSFYANDAAGNRISIDFDATNEELSVRISAGD